MLEESKISPNHSKTDHIFKVIAHAGKHSRHGVAVLKYAIDDLLKEMKCDFYSDMNNGVFLVRIKVKKITFINTSDGQLDRKVVQSVIGIIT